MLQSVPSLFEVSRQFASRDFNEDVRQLVHRQCRYDGPRLVTPQRSRGRRADRPSRPGFLSSLSPLRPVALLAALADGVFDPLVGSEALGAVEALASAADGAAALACTRVDDLQALLIRITKRAVHRAH